MSRFAKDMTIADLILPLQLVQYIDMMFVLLCKFALVIASTCSVAMVNSNVYLTFLMNRFLVSYFPCGYCFDRILVAVEVLPQNCNRNSTFGVTFSCTNLIASCGDS